MQRNNALLYATAAVFMTGIIAVTILGAFPGDHSVVIAAVGLMVTTAVSSLIQNFKLDQVNTQAHAAAVVGGEAVKASKVNTEKLNEVENKLDYNTSKTVKAAEDASAVAEKTDAIHGIVNGRTDALLAKVAELEAENARLKGQRQA